MKKLVMGAAVLAAVFSLKADIASANIVGYQQVNTGTSPYITGGMCFVTPGTGTFALDDIQLAGSTYASDWINFINPLTSAVDPTKNATYWSKAEDDADGGDGSDIGWYDVNDNYIGDTAYPKGTAFLANFLSSGVTVTFSGEVLKAADATVDCTGKPYAYVANLYPGDLTLDDVKLAGSTYASDWLNFVNPATSAVNPTLNVTYWSAAEDAADGGDGSDIGWYDVNDNYVGDRSLAAGTGFLCNLLSPAVTITFPGAE